MQCYFEELTERHKILSEVATTALQIHMILNTCIYLKRI